MPTSTDTDLAARHDRVAAAWHETNQAIGPAALAVHDGTPSADPYRLQALLETRAHLWLELSAIADQQADVAAGTVHRPTRDLYAVACHYAAILDQEAAARVRFEHRIGTLTPRGQAGHLRLRVCGSCGRPWQASTEGACPACPAVLFGASPSSAAQAAKLPPPAPLPYDPFAPVDPGRDD
jgi:hypothetical protein